MMFAPDCLSRGSVLQARSCIELGPVHGAPWYGLLDLRWPCWWVLVLAHASASPRHRNRRLIAICLPSWCSPPLSELAFITWRWSGASTSSTVRCLG